MISYIGSIFLLVFGFGFVIFFHELGHFLAAKWVGIRVEQFAVGFGQAVLAWRKGIGYRVGTTTREMEARLAKGEPETSFGDTEYRLNWIPLGGYVKMLGQDDMKPGAESEDPRAYNRKSVGARMLVVSAGVLMNILLAAIGFMIVFLVGFNAPPAIVGSVVPGSPADHAVRKVGSTFEPAPLQVGDKILYFEGQYQHDFTKISLNVALSEAGVQVPLYVKRAGGKEEQLYVTPERETNDAKEFLMLGIGQAYELRGLAAKDTDEFEKLDPQSMPDDALAVRPGDRIVKIGEQVVTDVKQFYLLDRALQKAAGKPIDVTVADSKGATRVVSVKPYFQRVFGKEPLNFAGLLMRPMIANVIEGSPAYGKIEPGDVVVGVIGADKNGDAMTDPTTEAFRGEVSKAGLNASPITVQLLRDGKRIDTPQIVPSMKVEKGRYGLGVGLEYDQDHPTVAGVLSDSPAERAGVPAGAVLKRIDAAPVNNWFDVNNLLAKATPDKPIKIVADVNGKERTFTLDGLTKEQIAAVAGNSFRHGLLLHALEMPRKAPNPFVAAAWGVTETRDFVLQFYLTIKRMVQGSVSPKNMMGPLGMLHAGAQFAVKGTVWLVWFLSMISANLAVVNFLPIPIVDGGLFTFLVIEKIQGKPISPRAQSIAQVVGLAIILSVFLLVTYQDVMRLPIFN